MKLVAQWRAEALGAYDLIDLDRDRERIGAVRWSAQGGYQTIDRAGEVRVYGACSLDDALDEHARHVAAEEERRPKAAGQLTKVCNTCAVMKPISDFCYAGDGRSDRCRQCDGEMEWLTWREKAELRKQRMV